MPLCATPLTRDLSREPSSGPDIAVMLHFVSHIHDKTMGDVGKVRMGSRCVTTEIQGGAMLNETIRNHSGLVRHDLTLPYT